MKKMKSPRQYRLLMFALFTTLTWQFVFVEGVYSHSPHDVIDSLELSPNYEHDKTIFIIISDHLRKSTNGGYSWKELVNGLDHKHLLSSIAISPSYESDQTVIVSSDGDGIYRSTNGGKSWKKINQGLDQKNIRHVFISAIHFDGTVLAAGATSGLYQTKNGGGHWRKVIDQAKITALTFYPKPKKEHILAGDSSGRLYYSADMGATWKIILKDTKWGAINSLAIAFADDKHAIIFIGTQKGGILKSIDEGVSFTPVNEGIPEQADIQSLALVPDYETNPTIFASAWQKAVFRSTDGGGTWKIFDRGLTRNHQADTKKYHSPQFRNVRIVKSSGNDKTVFLAGFDGLFKSENSGQNWFQLETLPVDLIKSLAVSPGRGNYSIAITTYGGGAYLSSDMGNSWLTCNKGLKTTRLSDIVFSHGFPSDKTLYSASMGILLKSTDGGHNWQKINLNPKSWRYKVYLIGRKLRIPRSWCIKILKDSERRRKWPTVIALVPGNTVKRELYFATRYQGVFKSEDSGLSYSQTWGGLGRTITSMVISPDFNIDGTLFASIRGLGIYATRDKGKSWYPSTSGLSFLNEWQKSDTIHQIFAKDIKMAISSSYATDKTLFAGSSEGLFKTTDGGMQWVHLQDSHLSKNDYIIGLGVSPNFASDRTLFVSIRGKGLLKSEDAGLSFRSIAPALLGDNHAIEFIEFSPNYTLDHTMYAASDEALFKSTNGGIHWKIIERPVRYENHREIFRYSGKWSIVKGDDYSASTISVSNDGSAEARLDFVSSAITLIGPEAPDLGIAEIFIDGKFLAAVDQFNQNQKAMKRLYSINGLSFAPHTIVIRVSDDKNPASKGKSVAIDAVEILR